MATLDRLPPDQRAVLQLVLQRRRSYDDIAAMLAIDRAGVRERALGAIDALGPESEIDPVRRGLITDYLLGQLPDRVADDVNRRLASTPSERAWARVVAGELGGLSDSLPEIPPAAAASAPAAQPSPPAARESLAESAPATAPTAPEPTGRARTERRPSATGEPRRAPSGSGARPPSDRRGGALLLAGGLLAVIIVVVLVIVLTSGGSSKHSSTTAATTSTASTASTSTTGSASSSAKVVAQVNLLPPGGAATGGPGGVAFVVRQGAQEGLVVRAQKIPANTKHDAYAVWLTIPGGASQFLGFVNPGVAANGNLQTAGVLPAGSARFKQLLVTLETQAKPKVPGKIVLQGPFNLPG